MIDTTGSRTLLSTEQDRSIVAPAPVESEDHVGLALAPIASIFGSLIPANARRGPARARSTFRAVA